MERNIIGVDARTFTATHPNGPIRMGLEFTRQLISNSEVSLRIFGNDNVSGKFSSEDIVSKFHIKDSPVFNLAWEQTMIPYLGRREGIDVLYTPNSYAPLPPTEFPCVITIHDLASLEGFSSGWYSRVEKNILPIMAEKADYIISPSNFTAREVSDHLNISRSEIGVVPNGVSSHFFESPSGELSFNLPEQYLLYVGSKSRRKNFDGVISAYDKYLELGGKMSLVTVGPEHDPTTDKIDSESNAENRDIINPGFVTDPELNYLYTNANCFVFPSRYEGFGIPPLEAMASSTPVIASDRTAMPEILEDAAHYVSPEDPLEIAEAIRTIETDSQYRQKLVRKGGEQARKYRWDKAASILKQELESVANSY